MCVCTVSASTHSSIEIHTFRAAQICHNNGFKYTAITGFVMSKIPNLQHTEFCSGWLDFFLFFFFYSFGCTRTLKLVTRQLICSPNICVTWGSTLRLFCLITCHVLAHLWILSTSTTNHINFTHCSAFFVLFFLTCFTVFQAPGLNNK